MTAIGLSLTNAGKLSIKIADPSGERSEPGDRWATRPLHLVIPVGINGEDVDFYRGLKKFAKVNGRTVRFIRSPRVRPSARRFDKWPIWKVLIWTNTLYIALFRRWKKFWGGWYSRAVR